MPGRHPTGHCEPSGSDVRAAALLPGRAVGRSGVGGEYRGQVMNEATDRPVTADLVLALRALMEIQDCIDDCWCDEVDPADSRDVCEACQARAAIARAEGTS